MCPNDGARHRRRRSRRRGAAGRHAHRQREWPAPRYVALIVFLLVGIAGWRRRTDTHSNAVIIALALAVTATVLGFFAVDTLQNAPETFSAIIALGLLAVVLDALVRRGRHRPSAPPPPAKIARHAA